MKVNNKALYSLIGGVVITLITGLLPSPTQIVGIGFWGLPWPWLSLGADTEVIWQNLFFDTIAWIVVTYVGIELFESLKFKPVTHRKTKKK